MNPTDNEMPFINNMDMEECMALLGNKYIGCLAYIFEGTPHINPITYFHDAEEKSILSYSSPGHKIKAMERYGEVAFQIDEINSIQNWRSVLVKGRFEQLKGSTVRKYMHKFAEGVQRAIQKKEGETPHFIKDFSSRLQNRELPIVYRLHITDIVGKFRADDE
jgi:nitroimidazol reductase NimA-like FMN-containing flavoprotein (pyridoxamine 5'-phosphate oxidase superfamily)